MKLNKLIREAASAYPDQLVLEYWDMKKGCTKSNHDAGDTLAQFIARELQDTFYAEGTDSQQYLEAARAMSRAAKELMEVGFHLRRLGGLGHESP